MESCQTFSHLLNQWSLSPDGSDILTWSPLLPGTSFSLGIHATVLPGSPSNSPPQSLRPPLWVPKFHSSCSSVLTLQVLTDNLIRPYAHHPLARFWESSSLIVPFKVHPCLDVLTPNPLSPKCVTPAIHSAIVHLVAQGRTSAAS